ncbi:MAG: divalent cation transporter [Candidatus Coatesbacteria bacterium]|nr:divalent cation transporter [Candidatus Coatesbacteria bacterium]
MNGLFTVLIASWLAGVAAFVGGIIARFEGSKETEAKGEIIHGVVALGGGILVAAVAFALAPQGVKYLSTFTLAVTFCLGGVAFAILDAAITIRGGTRAQFMGMLLDFLPEAISLGAVFGHDRHLGLLLALFIGLQNLPEGFNAYRETVSTGAKPRRTLIVFLAISLLGPLFACLGYFLLQDHVQLTAGIMCFAAGGILYLVFQDIAPQSVMRRHWTPPLGAVLGFVIGMVCEKLIG